MNPIECSLLHQNHDINLSSGFLSHCCRFKAIEFNSKEFEQLGSRYLDQNSETRRARTELANGIRTARCQDCWDIEDKNLTSWRLIKLHDRHDDINLNVQLSTLCNQACYYCVPESSSTIAKYGTWINSGTAELRTLNQNKVAALPLTFQTVIGFVKTIDSRFKTLNLSLSGGEPFLIEDFDDNIVELATIFLSSDDSRKVNIVISTNTNTKPDKLRYFYDKVKSLDNRNRIIIGITSSIENIEERAEYVRDGLVWSNFEENFKIHHSMAQMLTVRLTVNPFTIAKITDFVKYFNDYPLAKFGYNFPFQKFLRMDVLDRRFSSELSQLEEYIIQKNIGYKFEKQFYKILPDMLLNDRLNARLFKKAITQIDEIKKKNWRPIFPEYVEWFDSIN